jgi:hypothetical protein
VWNCEVIDSLMQSSDGVAVLAASPKTDKASVKFRAESIIREKVTTHVQV